MYRNSYYTNNYYAAFTTSTPEDPNDARSDALPQPKEIERSMRDGSTRVYRTNTGTEVNDFSINDLLAGHCKFTVVSVNTGKWLTYKVTWSEKWQAFFVGVLTGPDNTSHFASLGRLDTADLTLRKTSNTTITPKAQSWRGFEWLTRQLRTNAPINRAGGARVLLAGTCNACGRDLTREESITRGYGRKCADKRGIA